VLDAWATADENPALRDLLVARREGAVGLSRAVIERALARGELLPDLDAEELARAFTSMLDGLFLQRAEQGQSFTADRARRQALALVDVVFHAAAPRDRPQYRKESRPWTTAHLHAPRQTVRQT